MLLLCSCLFGIFISHSGASVSLAIDRGMSSFQDGSKVILICTISPYNNAMTWLVNNDPYADCFLNSCGPISNKPYKFIFNFDESNGEFNLTIQSVNTSHADLLFACDDGIERKTITFNVTTGDKDQNNSSITNTTSTTVNKPGESDGPLCDTLCIVLSCIGGGGLCILVIFLLHYCVKPKFTKIKLRDTKIYLEWTDSLNCCCQRNFGYNIVCNPIIGHVKDKTCQKSTKENHCTLKNLDPMAIYKISLSRKFCCFKSSATERYVITRKKGMLNDQEYNANATSIFVRWTKPDCISNSPLKYQVTCNKILQNETDDTTDTLENLIACETYEIEVFTIYIGKSCLLLAEEITAAPIKLCLEDVCYVLDNARINSKITWTVEYFDSPDFISGSEKVGVICRQREKQVHRGEVDITDSSYTLPDLYLDRIYTVYVYVIYNSVYLETPVKIKLKPYKPTNLKYTEKSTEIDVAWTKPHYTGNQELEYLVTCNGDEVENTSTTACTIPGLVPGETYEIKIYTLINLMKSQPLVEKITTLPHAPTNLTFHATSTQIELTWKKPEDASNQKLEYEVTCNQVQVKTTSNTSCKVENLNSRQQYDIEIFTVINGKKSLPLKQNIRTQPSPPIASHSNITGQQTVLPEIPLHNVNLVSQKRV